MGAERNYWIECIAIAAEECDLSLTQEQLEYLASSAKSCHENYGMAFYSPPASERLSEIEEAWKEKIRSLRAEFDAYKGNAEAAIKNALRVGNDGNVSIGQSGEVLLHGGRTTRIQ